MNHFLKRSAVWTVIIGIAVLFLATVAIDKKRRLLASETKPFVDNDMESVSEEKRFDISEAKRQNRRVLDEAQIAARVKSMLNLKAGEVGMIDISSEEVEQLLSSIKPDWIPHGSPFRTAEVSKTAIASELESMLKRGCKLRSKFGEPSVIEFSGENFRLTLMQASDHQPDQAEIILNLTNGELVTVQSISISKDNVLLLSPSAPKSGAILIVVETNPNTPAEMKKQ